MPPMSGPSPTPHHSRLIWTLSQRRAILLVLIALCAALTIRYGYNPLYISDPQPAHPARDAQLADRIDPNTADLDTLVVLPTLGEKRAQAIIDFRHVRRIRRPDRPPFLSAEDLLAVKGIGPATVDTLRPYLIFPPHETGPVPHNGP